MATSASPLDGVKGRQQRMRASGDDAAAATRLHPNVDEVGGDEWGIGGRALTAGQAFVEDGGDVHVARNECSGPVELNAIFLARSGTQEFLAPVARPKGSDV